MNETALQDYMRHFDDYLESGMNFTELSQIRQLDIHLQSTLSISALAIFYLELQKATGISENWWTLSAKRPTMNKSHLGRTNKQR